MTLQHEGDEAPVCTECKGDGGQEISWCPKSCPNSRTPMGCVHEIASWEKCSRCEGSKVEPCDFCGEPSTHRRAYTGQPSCDECARPVEDGPLGGMGFGIDYSGQQEAARLLE